MLYHFPSKSALLGALIEYVLSEFDLRIEQLAENDALPGAWTRGYIRTTFSMFNEEGNAEPIPSAALIGILILEPALMATYAAHLEKWTARCRADGISGAATQLIRFAVDGLWFNESMGLRPLSGPEREKFLAMLVGMTTVKPSSNPLL
ncbi:TetR/AcrR family transcriptional regulator [Paraburkholderia sp. GAS32]|uniref:TetR/AcrR family transcriptional regulator n=1 Tax=Paraburkholderia sp. GAS32 TaxID=3035129 RepID=UPI003D1A929E